MGYYITPQGEYYEGDKADWQDQEVPQRPDANHTWDGSAWVPAPLPAPLPAPEVVTMRQARLALLQSGLLAQVNTAIANMPGAAGDTARIEWEFSSTVERNRPLVQSLIGALGLTESQLDDLFRLAATL